MLDEVADAGYAGNRPGTSRLLRRQRYARVQPEARELALSGGFFELPFSDPAAMPDAMRDLDSLLDVFDAAPPRDGALKPKPTLADIGSDLRRAGHSRPGATTASASTPTVEAIRGRHRDGSRMLPRTRLRAHPSSRDRHVHRSALGDIEKRSSSPRSACASTPGTCCSAVAIRCGRCRTGASASTTSISRTRAGGRRRHRPRGGARRRDLARHAFCRLGEGDLDVDAVLEEFAAATRAGSWSSRTCFPTRHESGRGADQRANREYLPRAGLLMAIFRLGLAGAGRMGRNHLKAIAGVRCGQGDGDRRAR